MFMKNQKKTIENLIQARDSVCNGHDSGKRQCISSVMVMIMFFLFRSAYVICAYNNHYNLSALLPLNG